MRPWITAGIIAARIGLALLVFLAAPIRAAVRADETPTYVGARGCATCHAAEFDAWRTSHHALAMQPATPTTVEGDFSDVGASQPGISVAFSRKQDELRIITDGPDGHPHSYRVAYTFGVFPLQQYLVPWHGGRYQAFGVAWDSRPRSEGGQRWFSLYSQDPPKPGDPLHWTGRDQTWNYQCADCHSTDLRKHYDLTDDSYATTFTDIAVACEACHGPGSRHVAWAKAGAGHGTGPDDAREGLAAWLPASDRGAWIMDPHTGIARRTTPPESDAVLNTCGGCHARRSVILAEHTASTPFLDAYRPALLEPGLYYADGQIDGEVYEYGSFLQSRMFRAGVTCTNCHDPHAGGRVATGNALCAQCHIPQRFDATAHHHHPVGSTGAQCVNCHMPAKVYMGVDRRRDHSFRVPRPDLTLKIGVPNTCNQCHADKSANWAATTVAAWFPNGRHTTPHYGLALHAARIGAADAERQLDALIRDTAAPGIARASALASLPPFATLASAPVIVQAAADREALVRMEVPAMLASVASAEALRAVLPLLADPVRAVRIQAARALVDIDPQLLTQAQRQALAAATRELVAAELIDADRPEAHLNLGLLSVRQGDVAAAETEYSTALRLDPAFVPALVNLADLDRMRGLDEQGAALLRKAVAAAPANAEVHHALGLLLIRRHDLDGALIELRRANELDPDSARYAYVYAIALSQTGFAPRAARLLEQTHQRHPADRDTLRALISIEAATGHVPNALRHAEELTTLDPSDRQARQMVEELRRLARTNGGAPQ